MTEKMLSSTNQDPAHNGSTLLVDSTEQLSCIVQEPNIFITHHVSDVASEIDQTLGHWTLKTVSGCNWKVKSLHTFHQRHLSKLFLHPQVGCAQLKQTDMLGLGLARTVVYTWLDNLHVVGFKYGNLFSRYFEIYSMWTLMVEELLEGAEVYLKQDFLWLISGRCLWPLSERSKMSWWLVLFVWMLAQDCLENCHILGSTWNRTLLCYDSSSLHLWEMNSAESSTIFSEDCVFCLLVVSAPLMTINTEYAFYSTF